MEESEAEKLKAEAEQKAEEAKVTLLSTKYCGWLHKASQTECTLFYLLHQKLQQEAEKKAAEEALRIKAEEERAAEEAKVRDLMSNNLQISTHIVFQHMLLISLNHYGLGRTQKKRPKRKQPRKHLESRPKKNVLLKRSR